MTNSELKYFKRLVKNGWEVGRNGWPDFLALKDGKIRLIELKTYGTSRTKIQKRMHEMIYRAFGLKVEVIYTNQVDQGEYVMRLLNNVNASGK